MIGSKLINKFRSEKIHKYIVEIDKIYNGNDDKFLYEYIEELLSENENNLLLVLDTLELMYKKEMIKKGIDYAKKQKNMGRVN